MRKDLDKYIGSLVGGAIGDALGAPVEFTSANEIFRRYGSRGIENFVEYPDGLGAFTDDTQMLLFTAEGLLRAWHRSVLKGVGGAEISMTHLAYLRWLVTQDYALPEGTDRFGMNEGWLIQRRELYKQRAPGNTCLAALQSGKMGTVAQPINDSKGCGTVMRIAPAGLVFVFGEPQIAFDKGVGISAITHGHPSGYLSGGVLAMIFCCLVQGESLELAIEQSMRYLSGKRGHEEVTECVRRALEIHRQAEGRDLKVSEIESLGAAWVAEEALAISLLCALHYPKHFEQAVLAAVNHSGDSDSTGAITGNLVGFLVGEQGIPERWRRNLMYADIVRQMAEDLFTGCPSDTDAPDARWLERYPGY